MDDSHNQDGLNGLPLEPWMNQQHLSSLHPSFSSQVYNQPMSTQSLHDFMSHRTLQTFSTGDPIPHIGQSSQTISPSTLHQYSLSTSARLHHPEHLSVTHERSAWSHLLSLDPSAAAMGSHMSEPQESLRHCLPQDAPRVVQNTRQEQLLMLKGNTKLTASFDNTSLPKMHFSLPSSSMASIQPDSYSQMSAVNSSQNNISQQFTQLMNTSKKPTHASKPAVPKTLPISTDVSSLESSGSYSPVSPPATDIDQPNMSNSGQNFGRVSELFLKESHEIPSATFPLLSSSDQADIFNYLSDKTDPFSSDLIMQDSCSEPTHSLSVSSLLPSPSDVPLDMTTAFGSKLAKESSLKESSQTGADFASSFDSITSDKPSLIQALLTKDQPHPKDVLNDVNATSLSEKAQLQFISHVTSDEKVTKPVKSTPKKSNFYGRDASLFSFVPPSSLASEGQISSHHFSAESTATEVTENKNIFNSSNDVSSDVVCIQEQDRTNNAPERNTITTAETKLIVDVRTSIDDADSEIFPIDTVACVSSSSITTSSMSECITSQSQINDKLPESIDGTEPTFKQTDNVLDTEVTGKYDSANDNFQCPLNSDSNMTVSEASNMTVSEASNMTVSEASNIDKEHDEDNNEQWNQNFDISNQISQDFLNAHVTNKTKPPKRKKRKASGFQAKAKQRKKPVKKKLKGQQMSVFDNGMNVESSDHSPNMDELSTEVSEQQDYENVSYSSEILPSKRKTRQLSKARISNSDLIPRRSSSRQSKANAMRLIELQADSNYSGISQSPVVEKKTRKRKNSSSLTLATSDDFSELSGDSTEDDKSDEQDGDYIVDEDEVETLDKDELLEQQIDKKAITEKRIGGLKISIKLSGNSSAEIVSGIKDFHTKKKRKTAKKKSLKIKGKHKAKTHEQQDGADVQETQYPSETGENVQDSSSSVIIDKGEEAGNPSDVKDRHMSLMEKYFSTANSATVARQIHKKTVPGKESIAKKRNSDGTKSKSGKSVTLKSGTLGIKKQSELGEGGKQKAVKFTLESTAKKDTADKGGIQEDAETAEVPKFVCGYCPQRYHNKQELLAHMEAHMVEMERKTDTEATTPTVDDSIKDQAVSANLAISRGPKLNRPGTSTPLSSGKTAASEKVAERDKSKGTSDQDKDSDFQNVKQKFSCGECGHVFDSKPSLLDHVRIHTADKPFECDICHKCFTERNLLSVHRKTHGQEKLLRCQVCSKAFVHKADLNLHLQSHPRRSNTKSTSVLSVKKSLKKYVDEKHDEDDIFPPSKKPKSFASALTGETDSSGKVSDTSPVLILTRRDGPTVEVKNNTSSGNKSVLSEPKVVLKSVSSAFHKPNVIVKTNSSVIKPVEIPLVSSSIRGDNSKNGNNVESHSDVKSSGEASASSVCTCKECPDCVTRFLQSFQ